MMILAEWTENGYTKCELFFSHKDFMQTTWENADEDSMVDVQFVVTGKTYAERKSCVEEIAITYSNMEKPGLYYSDLIELDDWFRTQGERYGLLQEFKENCIC